MLRSVLVSSIVIVTLLAVNVQADVFSLDGTSETVQNAMLDLEAADLFGSGPNIHVASGELGLTTGDDLNALSAGLDVVTLSDVIYFSVDRLSFGTSLTGVDMQARMNDQAGDVFVTVTQPVDGLGTMTFPQGDNALVYDDDGSSAPGFGIIGGNMDNLDAYSQDEFDFSTFLPGHDVSVYFSLALGSTSLGGSATADDILISNPDTMPNSGTFGVFKDGVIDIGLADGDDLDALALEILDLTQWGGQLVEEAYFSLAPNSPTLLAMGYSAADVFYTNFDGTFSLAYTAAQLGLLEGDNVDALETNAGDVPEPVTLTLLGLGGLGMLLKRKRR